MTVNDAIQLIRTAVIDDAASVVRSGSWRQRVVWGPWRRPLTQHSANTVKGEV
jgi:hypothetical protein